ncbi:hypothetical protein ACTXT7_003568 [Hymenolepis weldensis]
MREDRESRRGQWFMVHQRMRTGPQYTLMSASDRLGFSDPSKRGGSIEVTCSSAKRDQNEGDNLVTINEAFEVVDLQ